MTTTKAVLLGMHAHISTYMAKQEASELPVNLSYVDDASGTVVVGVPDITPSVIGQYRRMFQHRIGGWPRMDEALTFVRCGPASRHAKKEYNRPLVGGLLIIRQLQQGRSELGTICIAARQGTTDGFVTAGHVATKIGTQIYQPNANQERYLAGNTMTVSAWDTKADSDSAFVSIKDTPATIQRNEIWKSSDTRYTVTGVAPPPALDDEVYMQGAAKAKERKGRIVALDVSVKFEEGGVLDHQLLANYVSESGDSGAPVYRKQDDSNVELIGLNVGSTEPQYVNPAPDPHRYPPPAGGEYAVISPWLNIAADLNVAL